MNRAGETNNVTNIKAILGRVRASSIFCQRLVYSMVLIIAALMQEMHFGGRPQRGFPKRPGLSAFTRGRSYHDGIKGMLLKSNIDPNTV